MTPSFTCYYPVFDLPPNKLHFSDAVRLSQKIYISEVIILIPNTSYLGIDQEQSAELFQIYTNAYPMVGVRIQQADDENLFKTIKDEFDKNSQINAYIALDEKTARSKEFENIFGHYENMQVELANDHCKDISDKMRAAIKADDKNEFFKYIPEGLSSEDRMSIWKIVKPSIEELVQTKKFWKMILSEGMQISDVFNTETTGMPNYDIMLKDPAYFYFFKQRKIELKEMTPEAYIRACAKFVHSTDMKDEMDNIKEKVVAEISKLIDEGIKVDVPVLNIADKTQEGRHRSMVAKEKGLDKIPVYVVSKVSPEDLKRARDIATKAEGFTEARDVLKRMNVPMDEKTFEKLKWKSFKQKVK